MLGAAALLAKSGFPPAAVTAFSSTKVPCNLRCSIFGVSGDIVDDLADLLLSFGALSTSVQEGVSEGMPEQKIFADDETWRSENRKLWDTCKVDALFDTEHDILGTLDAVKSIIGVTDLQVDIQEVMQEEWEEAIKASYVPAQIDTDLWIVPHWCEPPNPEAINIILEPGMAFGTGEHPTTRLCLSAVRKHVRPGDTVMDYGTGSGILGIGALLFGAAQTIGTDVDAFAVRVASSNAALNGVEDMFEVLLCGEGANDADPLETSTRAAKDFDIVVANILRGPLIELKDRLLGYTKSGGRVILSGIIEDQVPQILQAYSPVFESGSVEVQLLGNWAVVTGLKV